MLFDKAITLLAQGYVCDHCLGRQFSQLLTGMTNDERGKAIRLCLAMAADSGEIEVEKSNFCQFKFRLKEKPPRPGACILCDDVFNKLDKFVHKAARKLRKIEFDSFLVGTKLPSKLVRREESVWEDIGIQFCEPLRAELNRVIGKKLEACLLKPVRFKRPDVTLIIDMEKDRIELQLAPLCVFGWYKKLAKIPQTRWPTPKYKTSVEQIIAKPIIRMSRGVDEKFHAPGREDVDTLCLAWRPFILEVKEPKKRKLNMAKIRNSINKSGKIAVKGLRVVSQDMISKVKDLKLEKTYRVLVKLEKKPSEDRLEKLGELPGEISQMTPTRLLPYRPDVKRKRKVLDLEWKQLRNKLELLIRVEPGTYVKEFVTGDVGRTLPSVAEVLSCKAEPVKLEVIRIHLSQRDLKFLKCKEK